MESFEKGLLIIAGVIMTLGLLSIDNMIDKTMEEKLEGLEFMGTSIEPWMSCLDGCGYYDYKVNMNGKTTLIRLNYTTDKWKVVEGNQYFNSSDLRF